MLKTFSKNSILVHFTLVLIVILIIPFSIFLTITSNNITLMENQSAHQYISSNLQVVSSTVDGILSNLEHNHTSLALNTEFIHAMKRLKPYPAKDLYSDYLQTRIIKDQIVNTAITNNYTDSVYAYSHLSNRIFSTKVNWNEAFNQYDESTSSWLISYEKNQSSNPWLITSRIEDDGAILSSYRNIKELDMPLYGLVSINVDTSTISNLLKDISTISNSYCFVTDGNGNYIGANPSVNNSIYETIFNKMTLDSNDMLQHISLDGGDYFVSSLISDYSNFSYVIAAPVKSIETISPLLKNTNLIFIGSTLIILVIFLTITYRYFYTPIRALFKQMEEVQKGNFEVRLPKSNSYEIAYINTNFNTMVSNIQTLIKENYINQLLSKEAQLKSIRNQLNEHFLYNTLDTIHWKARLEDAPETCAMTFSLAKFYRHSLSSGQDFVSICDVIEMIDNYLQIQKIRMADAFQYSLTCEDSLSDYKVLKYLFQPLVENALLHGGKNLDRQLILQIRFQKTEDSLQFSVEDNGVGISRSHLRYLREELEYNITDTKNLFALKTLQSQLYTQYGTDSKLIIESKEQQGCLVSFSLPLAKLKGGTQDVEFVNS